MPRLGEDADQIVEAGAFLHRDDVRTGDADIARVALAEMQQVAHHRPFERGEIAHRIGRRIVLVAVDRFLELVAERILRAPAEDQRLQPAPDSVLVRVAATGATSVIGHGRGSILTYEIGVGDAERGERGPLDLLHGVGLPVPQMIVT